MLIGSIKFQLAALIFYIVIVIMYRQNKRLKMLSTRCFEVFIGLLGVNLLLDIGSVIVIANINRCNIHVAQFIMKAFLLSLSAVIACVYLYVYIYCTKQTRFSVKKVVAVLCSMLVVCVLIMVFPINYRNGNGYIYTYGVGVYMVYVLAAVYMSLSVYKIFQMKSYIKKSVFNTLFLGGCVWLLTAVVQFVFPGMLTTGLTCTIVFLLIYLTFENPREYIDPDTDTYNAKAFIMMLEDNICSERNFLVIDVHMSNLEFIYKRLGLEAGNEVVKKITNYIEDNYTEYVFAYRRDRVLIIINEPDKEKGDVEKNFYNNNRNTWEVGTFKIEIDYDINVIICPQYAKNVDEIVRILNYFDEHRGKSEKKVKIVDDKLLEKEKRYYEIVSILQEAIRNDGFDVFYQPIREVKSGKFISAEALIRLKDKETIGFISPEEFIPIAEKKGLIMSIGEIVFEKVCRFAAFNDLERLGIKYIEVNLSAIQCIDASFPEQLKKVMSKYRINPSFINLEITETAAVESGQMLQYNMNVLRELGCSFAMDDFGTGYSNLAQMSDAAYDIIKIDKSLLWPCFENNENAKVIFENISNMINRIGLCIVVEGVENEEQAEYAILHGADFLQGYLYSRPVMEGELLEFLAKNN